MDVTIHEGDEICEEMIRLEKVRQVRQCSIKTTVKRNCNNFLSIQASLVEQQEDTPLIISKDAGVAR